MENLLPAGDTNFAVGFPFYLVFGASRIHPHVFFEVLAYVVGVLAYFRVRQRFGDTVYSPIRWAVFALAVAGGTLGSRLLYLFEDPHATALHLHDLAFLLAGKTIVGALFFGVLFVEAMKWIIGIKQATGDLYAIPLAIGIAIGRVGCFLTGLSDNTYGTASSLPWAVDFGDGIRRHPTQLYEALFLLLLLPVLYRMMKIVRMQEPDSRFRQGDVFKAFMVAYMFFRLLCDAIKPYPRILFGLGGIQWACLLTLLYYSADIMRWITFKQAGTAKTPFLPGVQQVQVEAQEERQIR